MTEKRVVIHATPHVREVRLERVPANPQPPSRDQAQPGAAVSISRSQPGSTPAQAPQRPTESSRPAVQEGVVSRPQPLQPTPLQPQFSQPQFSQPQPPAQPSVSSSRPAPAAEAAPTPAARAAEIPRELPGVSVPSVVQPTQPSPVQSSPAPSAPAPALGPERGGPAVAVKPQALVPAPVTSVSATPVPATPVPATPVPATSAPASAVPDISGPDPATPELDEQLNELARMTGYSYEALGGGVVRLRAELGSQGYSVLLATSQAAMHTPGWEQEADYRALLTREDEYPEGTGRFTEAALASLLDHAQLAPLTPVDLRGYWNTGSFDRRSAESVAELVSAHLAQRGVFSHVLLTLAQQPARSLVQPARLAERLGSGVNTAELHSILDTLSRPPFMALTPLPGGQYYLRSDVRELLGEMGHYAEGLRRRLRPAAGDD